MNQVLTERCPKCGRMISFTEEATKLLCPCGHSFRVLELACERLKMEKAQEERAAAKEKLAATEAEKAALQSQLNGTHAALAAIEGSQRVEAARLEAILDSMQADRRMHQAMTELLRAINVTQIEEQDTLTRLLREMLLERSGAEEKLDEIQSIAERILEAHEAGGAAERRMRRAIQDEIDQLKMEEDARNKLAEEFYDWSRSMQEEDVLRLKALRDSSDALIQGQQRISEKLNSLTDEIKQTKLDVNKGFDELRRQRLDKLLELYHQATDLQFDREFDLAEKKYRSLLSEGGADTRDAEVYWRILLCHYGVEYQDEEGKSIPIILRPDLTDPDKMSMRKELFAHCKNDEQKKHYSSRLKKIDFYMNRYREVRQDPNWEFDVFISVKQNHEGRYTRDSDAASNLYNFFIQDEALRAKGLRVFNSRYAHLPEGEEYEPYIITALMSAKVLIVVGSNADFMNSQWVKNEWSRFQYLQESERRTGGKSERILFCYLTGGMRPREIPKALNPDKTALVEGPSMDGRLRELMDWAFPDRTAAVVKPIHHAETADQIAGRMKAWLKLGQYQKVIDKYEALLDGRPELLEPWVCLYTLCAQSKCRTLEKLAATNAAARADVLYEFAYDSADVKLKAELDGLWETCKEEKTVQKKAAPVETAAVQQKEQKLPTKEPDRDKLNEKPPVPAETKQPQKRIEQMVKNATPANRQMAEPQDAPGYMMALETYVATQKSRLDTQQVEAFVKFYRLRDPKLTAEVVMKDLEQVYTKLDYPQQASTMPEAKPDWGTSAMMDHRKRLTSAAAAIFWRNWLPRVSPSALLPPQMTEVHVRRAIRELECPVPKGGDEWLGMIRIQHGFLQGSTVLLVAKDRLYISSEDKQCYPPKVVELKNVEEATITRVSSIKQLFRLDIRMKDGGVFSFGSAADRDSDVLDYRKLAGAINILIEEYRI